MNETLLLLSSMRTQPKTF